MARILLIEPNRILAQIYKDALKEGGYDISVAHDAQNAITTSDKLRPDLIVMEIQLIKHNGVEFLYELRSYPEWQDIPIVVNSIVPPSEFAQNEVLYKEIGINNYLYKPQTSLTELLRTIDNVLKTSPSLSL
jgi:DNA-binding response OmpR family regulator